MCLIDDIEKRRELTSAVAGALTPSCKVECLTHSQRGIVLVSLLHIPSTPLYKKLIKAFAIVQYVSLYLRPGADTILAHTMQMCCVCAERSRADQQVMSLVSLSCKLGR